jgi:isocitrate/isopropylmalate dehydrogenase
MSDPAAYAIFAAVSFAIVALASGIAWRSAERQSENLAKHFDGCRSEARLWKTRFEVERIGKLAFARKARCLLDDKRMWVDKYNTLLTECDKWRNAFNEMSFTADRLLERVDALEKRVTNSVSGG